jgi:hypothetical protein
MWIGLNGLTLKYYCGDFYNNFQKDRKCLDQPSGIYSFELVFIQDFSSTVVAFLIFVHYPIFIKNRAVKLIQFGRMYRDSTVLIWSN